MSTTTDLTTLKINYLSRSQYEAAKSGGTINENELYMTPSLNEGMIKLVTVDCLEKAACNALIDAYGNFIIIDFGVQDTAQDVIDAIEDNGGTTMVACILSHAHYDHIGGSGNSGAYKTIISNFTLSDNFTTYAPKRPASPTASSVIDDYDEFISYVTPLGDVVDPPDTSKDYIINYLPFRFYNTDIEKYYDRGADYTYNDTSLCCSVTIGANTIGFYGDLYPYGQSQVCEENIQSNTIMLAPHHGNASNLCYEFIAKTNPDYIICNRGSENTENNMLGAITAIQHWANNKGVGIYDTATNGTFVLYVDSSNVTTEATPFYYPQTITNYAAMRNAGFYGDTTPTSSTSLKDFLQAMEKNSSATFFITDGYQIATDLGITASLTFLKITKFTGGATNQLYDRTDTTAFYFAIEIDVIQTITHHQTIYGKYANSTYTIYNDDTANMSVLTINTAGTITINQASLFVTSSANNQISISRSGAYILTITNNSSNGDAKLTLGTTEYYVPTGGSCTYRTERAAGNYALTATYHTLTCYFEWIPPRYSFPAV